MTTTKISKVLRTIGQALTALGIVISVTPANAATINVNATCSLQDAIRAANADVVSGGCSAGSGADTIVLKPSSTIVLTAPDSEGNGLPVITSEITIEGNGSTVTRDPAAPDFRIFSVEWSDLTLNETTVSGGSATGEYVSLGGGIRAYYGSLELNDCVITGNTGTEVAFGAGVAVHGTYTTINRTTIAGNVGEDALLNVFGFVELNQSAVVLNDADGVDNIAGFTVLNDCTVSSNDGDGLTGYWFEANRSTITGNTGAGANIYYAPSAFNESIISGNNGPVGREIFWGSSYGVPTTDSNVIGFAGDAGIAGFSLSPTDIVPGVGLGSILDPALTANGGPTLTHLIRSNSPARDALGVCTGVDQRGVSRPQGESCDIGAVELVADPCATATASLGCMVNGVANQPCVGGNGSDVIVGTSGNDVILARAGNDTVWAAAGNDIVCGGEGNDALHGGSGDDVMVGGNGDDSISGDYGLDSLNGGTGIDACMTDAADVSIVTCN